MKNHTKLFIFVIILVVLTVAFNDSYTTVNIDNIATVVALGIDSDGNNNLKVSFQFTKPSSVSESGTSQPSSSIIKTVSASSISSAVNLMNNYTRKRAFTFSLQADCFFWRACQKRDYRRNIYPNEWHANPPF